MESVFNISGYAIENQVKFATCTLLGAALTWWNGQIRTLGPEAYAMTWEVLKKKMTDKYCPQGEIKKLEIELWNLKVKGKMNCSSIPLNVSKVNLISTRNSVPNAKGNLSTIGRSRNDYPETTMGHGPQQPFKRHEFPRSTGNTNVANTQRAMGQPPKEMVVLSVEHQDISKSLSEPENIDGGKNGECTRPGFMKLGMQKEGKCTGKP
ncbi:reverse transcriptase domain-containing protein [Tanacetum coccineum]